ncbi:MAG TPA: polysaccharide biosynthesis tyrosine autokinase [Blastocatellia bacterium]|nr:polysaccharide biosynthesis tyrosine autokinase [Blastocatellia bacterium]
MADERSEIEKIPSGEVLQPVYPRPVSYGYGQEPDAGGINLREIWRTIRKRLWLIIAAAVIITTIVSVEVYRTKSTYQAAAIIEIGKNNTTVVKTADVIVQTDDTDSLRTKMYLLKSRPLLKDVVLRLGLDKNPKFLDANSRKSLLEAVQTIWGKFQADQASQPAAQQSASQKEALPVRSTNDFSDSVDDSGRLKPYIDVLAEHLNVEEVPNTRLIAVSFIHTEPAIAASVANGVAREFVERDFLNQTDRFTKTSDWLKNTTRDLLTKVREAEQKLADYTREHGIFSTEGKETLTTNRLAELHTQVMRAETDRLLKQSLYEEVRQGRVTQLPEAFSDPRIAALQAKLSELAVRVAQLDVDFGPKHPEVVQVKQQMAVIQDQINAGRKTLEEKLKADYERAVRDEKALSSALNQAKEEAIQLNQDTIQYNILKSNVETAKTLYTEFLQKTNQTDIQLAEQHNNMRVVEPAEMPMSPVGPNRLRTIMIGLFFSLLAGIGLAFLLERLDNTIKTVEDVSWYMRLPALSVIPAISVNGPRRLLPKGRKRGAIAAASISAATDGEDKMRAIQLVALESRSAAAEAYRMLRTSMLLSAAGHPPRTILVTSGGPSEGKTTTVINTAVSLSQLGASVLIIDCDLRKPSAHTIFGLDHVTGLSTYLSQDVELDGLIHPLQIPNLSLLPCGPVPPNPAELLSSDKMKALLQAMAARYDHILLDSPPLISVTDPVILSTIVDGVILVVHGGKSTREMARRARQDLESVGAKIFGVVLNNVDMRREGYDGYYYQRYYSSYPEDNHKPDVSDNGKAS